MSADRKVCVVTGANAGIGFEAALQLAERGAHVVMACRNQERGEAALRRVRERSNGSVELMLLDTGLRASSRSFNHVGPVLLTELLLDALVASRGRSHSAPDLSLRARHGHCSDCL